MSLNDNIDLHELNLQEMFNSIEKALEHDKDKIDLIKSTRINVQRAIENRDADLIHKTLKDLQNADWNRTK